MVSKIVTAQVNTIPVNNDSTWWIQLLGEIWTHKHNCTWHEEFFMFCRGINSFVWQNDIQIEVADFQEGVKNRPIHIWPPVQTQVISSKIC